MNKIKNVDDAIELFFNSAQRHADASEVGDYKGANKYYAQIVSSINFLKNENLIDLLLPFLTVQSNGVRMWAATYLLPAYESRAIATLKDIIDTPGIHSLSAETTLHEWQKGNLHL